MDTAVRHISVAIARTNAYADLAVNEFGGLASATEVVINSAPLRMIIKHGAFTKTIAEGKPVRILWQHDIREPIGLPTHLKETDEGLVFTARVSDTQRGREALTLMRDDVVDAVSIGFNPTEFGFEEINGEMMEIVTALDLVEISVVTFPANPLAEIRDVNGALEHWRGEGTPMAARYVHALEEIVGAEEHAVVPFKSYPAAPEGMAWDGDRAVQSLRKWAAGGQDFDLSTSGQKSRYRRGFTFVREEGGNFGDYILPHHEILDGEVATNQRGVVAAIAAINGARGGVDLSDAERKGAYNHLAKHLREMDVEPPEFRQSSEEPQGESAGLSPEQGADVADATRARHLDALRDGADFLRNDLDPLDEDTIQMLVTIAEILQSVVERDQHDSDAGLDLASLAEAELYHAGTLTTRR